MGFTLGEVERQVRFTHAAFTPHAVPGIVLGEAWTLYQQDLVKRVTALRSQAFSQVLNIALDLTTENLRDNRGAGVGSFPAALDDAGQVSAVDADAGSAVVEASASQPTIAGPYVPTSSTASTLEQAGEAWTPSAYAGLTLEILAGPGEPRQQEIGDNDADSLTGLSWTTRPTTATIYRIVPRAPQATDAIGVVLDLPATGRQDGYAVRLDATGQPYLDFTQPLTCRYDEGVRLPEYVYLHGVGQLRYSEPTETTAIDLPAPLPNRTTDFRLVPFGHRFQTWGPAGYVLGRELFLIGEKAAYQGVRSIEFRLVPLPPGFTSRDDAFLLPDIGRAAVVAYGCLIAARRVRSQLADGELGEFQQDWERAEATFLNTIGQQRSNSVKMARPWR